MGSFVRSSIRSCSGRLRLASFTFWAVASASPIACAPRYVIAPDSPVLITEGRGSVRIALHDGEQFVDCGWIDAADLEGLTAVKYDWSKE